MPTRTQIDKMYLNQVERLTVAIDKAAKAEGFQGATIEEDFQGISVVLLDKPEGQAKMIFHFWFGHPPRLNKRVKLATNVYVESKPKQKNGKDKVSRSSHGPIVAFFRGKAAPARWLRNVLRDAKYMASLGCDPEVFRIWRAEDKVRLKKTSRKNSKTA